MFGSIGQDLSHLKRLCCVWVNLDKDCFTRRFDLLEPENVSAEISKSRRLAKGSVPTIDTARQMKKQADTQDLTSRDKRMIKRKVRRFFHCIC